ncbi:hypothetical protein HYFRA_00009461 [Hymenoscyphus fraxineus]|uniref:Uncharacterized protein n=1 Tax=Hymenoscyphus fraxineus TaxID=746836 RepID=A0A9N9KW92_9HELO|nr:hypothetical protein HYFRA_00009461 [Hymenoscyphus fraxineus]
MCLLLIVALDGLNRKYSVDRTTYLPNVYWSVNETEANEAWNYISAGFGIVAVKAEYAKDHGLPDSEIWREDSSKRVYVLEAYHAIHCLRRIRSHYLALLHGNQWGWPIEHDMHCLDSLREYVMCNPDDTLLWTNGHGDVGHGQNKKCQDWDALRQWAGERTIAYFDYERGYEEETKGVYHNGDGLPVGSF